MGFSPIREKEKVGFNNNHEYKLIRIRIQVINACYQGRAPVGLGKFGSEVR